MGWFWNEGQEPNLRARRNRMRKRLRDRPAWLQAVTLLVFIPAAIVSRSSGSTRTPWDSSQQGSTRTSMHFSGDESI